MWGGEARSQAGWTAWPFPAVLCPREGSGSFTGQRKNASAPSQASLAPRAPGKDPLWEAPGFASPAPHRVQEPRQAASPVKCGGVPSSRIARGHEGPRPGVQCATNTMGDGGWDGSAWFTTSGGPGTGGLPGAGRGGGLAERKRSGCMNDPHGLWCLLNRVTTCPPVLDSLGSCLLTARSSFSHEGTEAWMLHCAPTCLGQMGGREVTALKRERHLVPQYEPSPVRNALKESPSA